MSISDGYYQETSGSRGNKAGKHSLHHVWPRFCGRKERTRRYKSCTQSKDIHRKARSRHPVGLFTQSHPTGTPEYLQHPASQQFHQQPPTILCPRARTQVMFWHRYENILNLHAIKVTGRVGDILGIDIRLRHFGRHQLLTYIVDPKSRFHRSAGRLPSAVICTPPFWSISSTCLMSRFIAS